MIWIKYVMSHCPRCGADGRGKTTYCQSCGATDWFTLGMLCLLVLLSSSVLIALGVWGLVGAETTGWLIASCLSLGLGAFIVIHSTVNVVLEQKRAAEVRNKTRLSK